MIKKTNCKYKLVKVLGIIGKYMHNTYIHADVKRFETSCIKALYKN